jgi:hypothetical protein
VETVPETVLDEAAKRLRSLDGVVRADPESVIARLVARIWGLVNEAARAVGPRSVENFRMLSERIAGVERDLAEARVWTPVEQAETLQFVIGAVRRALIETPDFGEAKAAVLKRRLKEFPESALLASDMHQVPILKAWLAGLGLEIPIYTSRTLEDAPGVSHLVCPAWPRSAGLAEAARVLCTPSIDLECHPFEAAWANNARKRLLQPIGYRTISPQEIDALLSRGAGAVVTTEIYPEAEESATIEEIGSVSELEKTLSGVRKGSQSAGPSAESVHARYVGFEGRGYTAVP